MKIQTEIKYFTTHEADVLCTYNYHAQKMKVSISEAVSFYPQLSMTEAVQKLAKHRFKLEKLYDPELEFNGGH